MTKLEMTEAVIAAKIKKGVTWTDIGNALGLSDVFTASACLGQNSLSPEAVSYTHLTLPTNREV